MNEKVLEDVILSFWNREFDLLLCTTIIESGIDIPNANTLIVDRSDLLAYRNFINFEAELVGVGKGVCVFFISNRATNIRVSA